MKLHNTLTRSTDEFEPADGKTATVYSCGPTVYDRLTIGNWTAFIRWDVLARVLRSNYELRWYMNITDVGHLVSDADEGEDKLEKGARREGKTAWEIASQYTDDFIAGLDRLNISLAKDHLVKATDHIAEQIELIKSLEEKGFTYIIGDGVYFDSSKFEKYGDMARLDIKGLQAGARVEQGEKNSPTDFALWKFSTAGKKRDMEWESPWGKGFPGWHVECSAMAMKYLGPTIDIHTGGIDHIPVHHTNEIAQSEASTGQQFARFWLHSNFLQVDGTKIAKSLGNGFTLQDLEKKNFTGDDFRMFVLQGHYRSETNFTWEGLAAAHSRLLDLQGFADIRFQLKDTSASCGDELARLKDNIRESLENDLNSPQALALISDFINKYKEAVGIRDREAFIDLLETIDELLGLRILSSTDVDEGVKDILSKRAVARSDKNWSLSDSLRDRLLEKGISVNDTPQGTFWQRI